MKLPYDLLSVPLHVGVSPRLSSFLSKIGVSLQSRQAVLFLLSLLYQSSSLFSWKFVRETLASHIHHYLSHQLLFSESQARERVEWWVPSKCLKTHYLSQDYLALQYAAKWLSCCSLYSYSLPTSFFLSSTPPLAFLNPLTNTNLQPLYLLDQFYKVPLIAIFFGPELPLWSASHFLLNEDSSPLSLWTFLSSHRALHPTTILLQMWETQAATSLSWSSYEVVRRHALHPRMLVLFGGGTARPLTTRLICSIRSSCS